MNYVITGSLGHISKPVVAQLVKAGHSVTVITSKAANVDAIEAMGAKAAVGSVADRDFVSVSFAGADAVYLMIPPNWAVTDWLAYQQQVADNYVAAIQANGVKKVVQLSSIGAHLRTGAGPIDGLGYLEAELEKLQGTDVKVLRPSYFYYNLFGMIPLIKGMGITGGNFGGTDEKLVLVHTSDIADVAAAALAGLDFSGYSIQYIASDERHPKEIAAILGNAIGKPDLPWVTFTNEQAQQGMLQSGLSATIAEGYTALGAGIQNGSIQGDYWKNPPTEKGKVKLEDFAQEFAAAYQAS
jgi:uncharacterized protein YbjT (DUF2867 family)